MLALGTLDRPAARKVKLRVSKVSVQAPFREGKVRDYAEIRRAGVWSDSRRARKSGLLMAAICRMAYQLLVG